MRLQMLRQFYDQACSGMPLLGTPEESAVQFEQETNSLEEATNRIVQRYVMLCGMTGFVCGLPGYATMPVTIPSNVAGVLLLQFHLCATMAVLGGHDPHDDAVRERAIRCVLGSHEQVREADRESESQAVEDDEAQGLLNRLATKLGERGVRFVGEQAARWIGRAASRAGRGARSLPLLGGAVGGLADGYATQEVGRRARRAFQPNP